MSLKAATIIATIRRAGPYLAIELILPGGSILALILWLVRNRASVRQHLAGIASAARNAGQLVAVRPPTASTL